MVQSDSGAGSRLFNIISMTDSDSNVSAETSGAFFSGISVFLSFAVGIITLATLALMHS